MENELILESILFHKGEPTTVRWLSGIMEIGEKEVRELALRLQEKLHNRGIKIIVAGDELMLATAPETSAVIERITKEEVSKDLGRAGLETLSVILYQNPVSKPEIDYIRGVNCQYILRSLLVRGLVKRTINNESGRVYLYSPTIELLSHLGITDISQLPEAERIRAEIKGLKENFIENE